MRLATSSPQRRCAARPRPRRGQHLRPHSSHVAGAGTPQVQGAISLNLWFEPEESDKGKTAGFIHVSINEGGWVGEWCFVNHLCQVLLASGPGLLHARAVAFVAHAHFFLAFPRCATGRDLAAHDPYVKMYLSEKNKNIRSSKLKTKVVVRLCWRVFFAIVGRTPT